MVDVSTDVVWPETKQIGVIDSIFRNFYIPPVIFGALLNVWYFEGRLMGEKL